VVSPAVEQTSDDDGMVEPVVNRALMTASLARTSFSRQAAYVCSPARSAVSAAVAVAVDGVVVVVAARTVPCGSCVVLQPAMRAEVTASATTPEIPLLRLGDER
jgi:hypothetical protein